MKRAWLWGFLFAWAACQWRCLPSSPSEAQKEPAFVDGSGEPLTGEPRWPSESAAKETEEPVLPESQTEPSCHACRKEGERRCGTTPEVCQPGPSGCLAWEPQAACLNAAFCKQGTCQPLPSPVWSAASVDAGIDSTYSMHQMEVHAQGHVIFLFANLLPIGGCFGSFCSPLEGEPTSHFAHLSPQGEWLALYPLPLGMYLGNDTYPLVKMARSPQGEVFLLSNFLGSFQNPRPPKVEGNLAIVRMKPSGGFASVKQVLFGDGSVEEVRIDEQGNFFLLGHLPDTGTLFQGTPHVLKESLVSRYYLAKLDPEGRLLWARDFPPEMLNAYLELDREGKPWLHGIFDTSLTVDGLSIQSVPRGQDWFLGRLDATGKATWLFTMPYVDYMGARPSAQGSPLVWGKLTSWNDPLYAPFRENAQTQFFGQLDPEGFWTWAYQEQRQFELPHFSPYGFRGHSTTMDPRGNFYLAGRVLKKVAVGEISVGEPSRDLTWNYAILALNPQGRYLPWALSLTCEETDQTWCSTMPFFLREHQGFLYTLSIFIGRPVFGETRLPYQSRGDFLITKWPAP